MSCIDGSKCVCTWTKKEKKDPGGAPAGKPDGNGTGGEGEGGGQGKSGQTTTPVLGGDSGMPGAMRPEGSEQGAAAPAAGDEATASDDAPVTPPDADASGPGEQLTLTVPVPGNAFRRAWQDLHEKYGKSIDDALARSEAEDADVAEATANAIARLRTTQDAAARRLAVLLDLAEPGPAKQLLEQVGDVVLGSMRIGIDAARGAIELGGDGLALLVKVEEVAGTLVEGVNRFLEFVVSGTVGEAVQLTRTGLRLQSMVPSLGMATPLGGFTPFLPEAFDAGLELLGWAGEKVSSVVDRVEKAYVGGGTWSRLASADAAGKPGASPAVRALARAEQAFRALELQSAKLAATVLSAVAIGRSALPGATRGVAGGAASAEARSAESGLAKALEQLRAEVRSRVRVQAPEGAAVAEGATSTSRPSLLQRYLGRSGGRWGSAATRSDNASIASYFEDVEGYGARTQGAGRAPEEWIRGPGGGTKGGTFVDVTVRDGSGRTIRIQTVSTLADEITPTASELGAADRIMAKYPGDSLLLVPKTK